MFRELPDDQRGEGCGQVPVQPAPQLYRGPSRGQTVRRHHGRLPGRLTFFFESVLILCDRLIIFFQFVLSTSYERKKIYYCDTKYFIFFRICGKEMIFNSF